MAEDWPEIPVPAEDTGDPASMTGSALSLATTTFCRGVLHALGMFDPAVMTKEERSEDPAEYRTWFCLGETCMAALLAANLAVPAFLWFAGIAPLPLAFIGAAVVFLPAFVFLPKLIRYAMAADTEAVIAAFGRNEQARKVFWAVFAALAGLVLAQVLDPETTRQILGILTGTGG